MAVNLDELRQAAPVDTAGMSDAEIMQRLYHQFGLPKGQQWDTFAEEIGYNPPPDHWRTVLDDALDRAALQETLNPDPSEQGLRATHVDFGADPLTRAMVSGPARAALAGVISSLPAQAPDLVTLSSLPLVNAESAERARDVAAYPGMFDAGYITGMAAESAVPATGAGKLVVDALPEATGIIGKAARAAVRGATEGAVAGGIASPASAGQSRSTDVLTNALGGFALPLGGAAVLDTPVSRALSKYVSEPIQKSVKGAVQHALEMTESGKSLLASRNAENILWKLQGRIETARMQASQMLKMFDGLHLTPEDRLALAEYQQDPTQSFPLTPKQQAAYTTLAARIKELGWSPGYMHRVLMQRMTGPGGLLRTLMDYKHLSGGDFAPRLTEPAEKSREMYRIVPVDGNSPPAVAYIRKIPATDDLTATGIRDGEKFELGKVSGDKPVVGQEITDPLGRKWKIETGTIGEIEQHSNVRYHHDLALSVAQAWRDHQGAIAWNETVNALKTDPAFYNLIRKAEDTHPASWHELSGPLQGYVAPPGLARTLAATIKGQPEENWSRVINNFSFGVNFVVPLWHMFNEGDIAAADALGRGFSPARALKFPTDIGHAFDQVIKGGDDVAKLMSDGFPFMRERVMGSDVYQNLIESVVREVDGPFMRDAVRQGTMDGDVLKLLGDGFKGMAHRLNTNLHAGLRWWEAWPVWTMDDAIKLRSVYARMNATGEDLLTAGKHVANNFPQYRLRTSTPGLGTILKGMQRVGLIWFLPYHMDLFRILGRRALRLATLDPEAARETMAQAALLTLVYPSLDEAVQKHYGHRAHVERFGTERIPYTASQIMQHKAPISRLVGLLLSPSFATDVVLGAGDEATRGEAKKSLTAQLSSGAKNAVGKFYPAQDWSPQLKFGDNLTRAFLSQIGVEGLKPPTRHYSRRNPYDVPMPKIPPVKVPMP